MDTVYIGETKCNMFLCYVTFSSFLKPNRNRFSQIRFEAKNLLFHMHILSSSYGAYNRAETGPKWGRNGAEMEPKIVNINIWF